MTPRALERYRWWRVARIAVPTLAGAAAGYLWYAEVGCASGGCPITSNPFLMTGLGAAFGLTLAWPDRTKAPPAAKE